MIHGGKTLFDNTRNISIDHRLSDDKIANKISSNLPRRLVGAMHVSGDQQSWSAKRVECKMEFNVLCPLILKFGYLISRL